MPKAFAELGEKYDRIEVHFPYDPEAIAAIKEVPGHRFVGRDKGGPFWTVPLDLPSGQALRVAFGKGKNGLQLGEALKSWAVEERRRQRELRTLALADDAELTMVPDLLPKVNAIISGDPLPDHPVKALRRKRPERSYQRADIAIMAQANVLNGNQPGTGKTVEYIGATAEAGLLYGKHLIIAPLASHVDTWVEELMNCDVPGEIFYGTTPVERRQMLNEAAVEPGDRAVWVILGFDDIRLAKQKLNAKDEVDDDRPVIAKDHKGRAYVLPNPDLAALYDTRWNTVVIDESHKTGLPNPDSLFARGAHKLQSERRYSMSGTPMGGKPMRLWGHLHWLEPDLYGSKWRWAETWLEITDNGYGKEIGEIKKGTEDAFYTAHAHHMVRRVKREALPGLPPKVIIDVDCEMTPGQAKQYHLFAADAEIRIEDERLSATSVLAEWARLKQFANAKCRLERKRDGTMRVIPEPDSGKLPLLLEKLDENGVRKTDPEPGARAIVGSESLEMIQMTAAWLRERGLRVVELTGATKPDARKAALAEFRADGDQPVVLAMTVQTGGVSLNLEMAGSVHALDETWNPDDMEQFEDRGDRGSRTEPLRCYYYRTKGTIQEYIYEMAAVKAITNRNILDVRRQILKEKNR